MMTKQNQLYTNYSADKRQATELSSKVARLLDDAVPKTIMGMLATAKETENSIVFFNRWQLTLIDKNDYTIIDQYSKDPVFEHIALLTSALHIIWNLYKSSKQLAGNEKLIYNADQEYFRCVENIKLYKKRISTVNSEDLPLFLAKIQDSRLRLQEIKTRLSKIY